jgi:hypothetical protein
MARINLKLLKLSDLKVTLTQQKQSYVFIKANGETISHSQNGQVTYSPHANGGFANLIRQITMNNNEAN